jgi:hypothetical protein
MPQFSRYHKLAADLALKSLGGAAEVAGGASAEADSVALAVPAALLLLRDDADQHAGLVAGFKRLAQLGRPWSLVGVTPGMTDVPTRPQTSPPTLPTGFPKLSDPAGHTRDVYHPFVLHLHIAAFLLRYESLPTSVWGGCEGELAEAVAPTRLIETWAETPPPPPEAALVLWQALCLVEQAQAEARDADFELADAVVHSVLSQKGEDGALQPQSPDESPDAWTYRELTGLHALSHLAQRRGNKGWARRVQEVAQFHVAHTQPDHVTNQPWGLAAFAASDQTAVMADQQFHDAAGSAPGSGGVGLVAALLLADAADALARIGA